MAYVLDTVKEHFHPEFLTEAAETLRERTPSIAAGLEAWSVAILAGLLNHVDNPKAMHRIYSGLDHFPPDLMNHPVALLRSGNLAQNDPKDVSGRLLGQLFGPKITPLNAHISAATGAAPAVVSDMLGIAGPMVLSILGQRLQAGELSVPGLANLLRAEQPRIAASIAPEMADIIGSRTLEAPDADQPTPVEGTRWGFSLLLLVLMGVAAFLIVRQCG